MNSSSPPQSTPASIRSGKKENAKKQPVPGPVTVLGAAAQRRTLWKNALDSPFSITWQPVGSDERVQVVAALNSVFKDMPERETKKHSDTAQAPTAVPESLKEKYKEVIIGLNAVTRGLEKDELRLVVCTKELPAKVLQHLPILCASRSVPLCPLSVTSQDLAALLGASGIRTMICLGFKRVADGTNSPWNEVVDMIASKCPKIDIPWLPANMSTWEPSMKIDANAPEPASIKTKRKQLLQLKVRKIQHTAPPKKSKQPKKTTSQQAAPKSQPKAKANPNKMQT